MKVKCTRCLPEEGIEIPEFTQEEKRKLLELKSISSIQAVKALRQGFPFSLKDSKYITLHINKHGECHRCKYSKLMGEYVACPKCKALNFNWEINV